MKVSGFTFVKNAIKFGYPVEASIQSVLPLVDEMIVSLGDSEDDTENLIRSIQSGKIKIIHSVWDKTLSKDGVVLAVETNKALDATADDADWLFYIQGDEAIHEKDYGGIKAAMEKYLDDKNVDGLLFNYYHFYGSFRYTGDGRGWYKKEIRVIRNNKKIRSYRDAQGFRWADNDKLRVKEIPASIYHYGWVRSPKVMINKMNNFNKFYMPGYEGSEEEKKRTAVEQFDYSAVDTLALFEGTHPVIMKSWVDKEDWGFERDTSVKKFSNFKHKLLYFLNKAFGWRPFEYRNYTKI